MEILIVWISHEDQIVMVKYMLTNTSSYERCESEFFFPTSVVNYVKRQADNCILKVWRKNDGGDGFKLVPSSM